MTATPRPTITIDGTREEGFAVYPIDALPPRIMQQLTEFGVVAHAYGGDVKRVVIVALNEDGADSRRDWR